MTKHEERQETVPEREEKILSFWKKKRIFEKTLAKTRRGKEFVFYEGPPTANAPPGLHHVEARTFKDIIPRYKTMRGFFVERKAGWDTHGLPVELAVEKALGLKSKKDIETYGVARFNEACRASVWEYKKEWERLTKRIGFWLDLEHPYITYETSYIESLWWIVKEFWGKGLLYQDFKVLPWCPRCQTGLSSHEVGLGYKKVKDRAVYVKFKLKGTENKYILAWTTTPWTLPGNVALAVNPALDYVRIRRGDSKGQTEFLILAKSRLSVVSDATDKVEAVSLKELIGREYEPLFAVAELKNQESYKIYPADFVNADEGAGVVHTAVMYGEEDYELGKKLGLPRFHTVDETGRFLKELGEGLAGLAVKDKATEEKIIQSLSRRGLLFKEEQYEHEYPFCWRCDSALLYYARQGWWVKMSQLKKELWKNNETINWIPEHIKAGRFGEFLKDVRDWAFSRERFWGTPLPIWTCGACGAVEVIGSLEELKKRAKALPRDGKKQVNLHRPYIDGIVLECTHCSPSTSSGTKKEMRRVPEVADVWFDSGAMPFAQYHFPFASTKGNQVSTPDLIGGKFQVPKLPYPADYIAEAIDQTRGWFYTLLAVATALGKKAPYKNAISLGHVLDKNGQKMSKSRGNVVNPWDMIEKYGADTIRWYFYTTNAPGDPKRFDERDIQNTLRGFLMTFWNCFLLFDIYVSKVPSSNPRLNRGQVPSSRILDRWILARLNQLAGDVTGRLDSYDITGAARMIESFVIEDFSQWYLRRSRRRLQRPASPQEFYAAARTTVEVLASVCELTAPFMPFLTEAVYQRVRKKFPLTEESVHLRQWPRAARIGTRRKLLDAMRTARAICSEALRLRAEARIKVRQPLAKLQVPSSKFQKIPAGFFDIIKEEINVKEITFGKELKLDTAVTPELREEGIAREMVRLVQEMRKDAGFRPRQKIRVWISASVHDRVVERWRNYIMEEAGIRALNIRPAKKIRAERTAAIDGANVAVRIV